MCRALTTALIGKSYENNTMTFEELLVAYAPRKAGQQSHRQSGMLILISAIPFEAGCSLGASEGNRRCIDF